MTAALPVHEGRALYRPTPSEILAACETLLRTGVPRPQRSVILEREALAHRDCARGLLRTAREQKAMNNPAEVTRLVETARWHWLRYREIAS